MINGRATLKNEEVISGGYKNKNNKDITVMKCVILIVNICSFNFC